jgi:hypothetical protein
MGSQGIIVVPYRDREEHLSVFLQKQQDRHIIIVEQEQGKLFNRGKLLNIGFAQSLAYDFFIFHDVDMIPVTADYRPGSGAIHIATMCEQFNYRMPFRDYFGGVTIMNKQDFLKCNGFPNEFWGWGAEDDELLRRVKDAKIRVLRRNCRFKSLKHAHNLEPQSYEVNVSKFKSPIDYQDGLNTLQYTVLSDVTTDNVRHIVVSV